MNKSLIRNSLAKILKNINDRRSPCKDLFGEYCAGVDCNECPFFSELPLQELIADLEGN